MSSRSFEPALIDSPNEFRFGSWRDELTTSKYRLYRLSKRN
jgi:hypothetical protein